MLLPARRLLLASVLAALAALLLAPTTAVRAEPSRAEIERRIEKDSAALEDIVEQYNQVNEELKETKQAIARHESSLPGLQTSVAGAEAEIGRIAVTAYKGGRLASVETMLTGETGTMLDRLGTLDQMARTRQAQLTNYSQARTQHDEVRRQLDNALAKQGIQARDLAARKKKIEADLKKLLQLRRQAYGQEDEGGSRYSGRIPSVSGKAGMAVRYAYRAIGTPYRFGGESSSGLDCSGLTKMAWKAAGKPLPHSARMQWNSVSHIPRSAARAGDLVFYRGLGHVALYVGNNKIIHATSPGRRAQLASVDVMPPYGFGRVG